MLAVRRQLARIPEKDRERTLGRIRDLAENQFPVACRKLKGARNRWCIRQGDQRVLYEVERMEITVMRIGHRSGIYIVIM